MTAGQREYHRKEIMSNRKSVMSVARETAAMTPAALNSAIGLDADQLKDEISMLGEQMRQNALKISELAESQRKERREDMEQRVMEEAREKLREENALQTQIGKDDGEQPQT